MYTGHIKMDVTYFGMAIFLFGIGSVRKNAPLYVICSFCHNKRGHAASILDGFISDVPGQVI